MRQRNLQFEDISKKCGFFLMSVKPEKNLNLIPDDLKIAYVIYDGDLYFIDKEAEKKCVYIKLDGKRKIELKSALQLNSVPAFSKDEKCRPHSEGLTPEQLENIAMITGHYPTWLHKIVLINKKATELKKQCWDYEEKFRALELRIARLELLCPKKFTASDLENLYPRQYKKTHVRPTDYRDVKLEELKQRIAVLGLTENKQALKEHSGELNEIASQYATDAELYLKTVKQYQELDTLLSDYSKNELTQENFREKVRADINQLPLELRLGAISIMPGATSLGALMDLLAFLKRQYEREMHRVYSEATGKKLRKETFEEIFQELFGEPAKEYFKKIAKRPTTEMANIGTEIEKIITDFWVKVKTPVKEQTKADECSVLLRTIIYLSCTLETFRFTDKVQRLDIASAVSGKIGSLFGGEDIAGEFLNVLTVTQVQNSFAMMPFASGAVTPLVNMQRLWLEVAIWLNGLHQRSYDQISPFFKENGSVRSEVMLHCGDDDDRKFFEHKTMVKWLLAQYHESHYQSLLLLLPPEICSELLPLLPQQFAEKYRKKYSLDQPLQSQNVNPEKAHREEDSRVSASLSSDGILAEQRDVSWNQDKAEKEIDKDKKPVVSLVCTQHNLFKPAEIKLPAKPFLSFEDLDKIKDKPDLEKFAKFNSILLKSELTEDQNHDIEQLRVPIIRILKNYKDSRFTKWLVPTWFWPRAHITEVKNAYDDISESVSPRDYITNLYKVWSVAYPDESTDIGPKAGELLTSCFNLLHSTLQPTNANIKSMQ
jgi:hypothetical protein